jgi:hypothetical protein
MRDGFRRGVQRLCEMGKEGGVLYDSEGVKVSY